MNRFRRDQRAAKAEGRIVRGAGGGDGLAEHLSDGGAHPLRGFVTAFRFDFTQDTEYLRGRDGLNRQGAEIGSRHAEQPALLVERAFGETVFFAFRDQLVSDPAECMLRQRRLPRVLGSGVGHWVGPVGKQGFGAAPFRAGAGERDLRIGAERKELLLAAMAIGHAPEL